MQKLKSVDGDRVSFTVKNPYTTQSKAKCQGSASKHLELAAKVSNESAINGVSKAPLRSLNNVLVANAKRIAKTGGIKAAAKATVGKDGTNQNKRS